MRHNIPMSLKILHIGKYYYPFEGGIETVVKDLCEGAAKKGHLVRVICSNTNTGSFVESINGIHVFRYSQLFNLNSLSISPALWFSIKKHAEWADIIHVHSPNPACEFFASLIAKKKVVVSTHHSDIYKQRFLKLLLRPFWNFFKSRLDAVIVPTVNHIKYSDMLVEKNDRYEIIPFGITDPLKKEEVGSEFLRNNGLSNYILFVGRLVEYKGLRYLIKAIEEVSHPLVIVGEGAERDNLEALVSQNTELKQRIYFAGRIKTKEELNYIYQKAFCFVLPSITKNENFGVVQLEAMANSLPVITTNIKSGVPLVGIPGMTSILVTSHSSSELSQAINALYDKPIKAKNMGKEGRKLFETTYTFDKMIDRHIELYKRLLNEK